MPDLAPRLLTDDFIDELVRRLISEAVDSADRLILGIAGIAASGKSTLAERIVDQANAARGQIAVLIPLDGFHLPNAKLVADGLIDRKGAPFTYDIDAYLKTLATFRRQSEVGGFPRYCRKVHEPVIADQSVTSETRLIVTEGQYLAVASPPWKTLGEIFHETWWLDTPPALARRWLLGRDLAVGRTNDQALSKYQTNDRLNVSEALSSRRTVDLVVRWLADASGASSG